MGVKHTNRTVGEPVSISEATISGLTASKPVFSDATKKLVSTGTVPVDQGGTGQTTYTNGQLLIGNTTGNTLTKATLTGTANQITVSNSTGSITLSTPQDINTSSSPSFTAITTGLYNRAAVTAATPSSAFTVDWSANHTHQVTITGADLDITFTNPAAPCDLTLYVIQGDGDDTIDWSNEADIKWPGGVAPTLSTGAADVDIITFKWNGNSYYGVANYDFS